MGLSVIAWHNKTGIFLYLIIDPTIIPISSHISQCELPMSHRSHQQTEYYMKRISSGLGGDFSFPVKKPAHMRPNLNQVTKPKELSNSMTKPTHMWQIQTPVNNPKWHTAYKGSGNSSRLTPVCRRNMMTNPVTKPAHMWQIPNHVTKLKEKNWQTPWQSPSVCDKLKPQWQIPIATWHTRVHKLLNVGQ